MKPWFGDPVSKDMQFSGYVMKKLLAEVAMVLVKDKGCCVVAGP